MRKNFDGNFRAEFGNHLWYKKKKLLAYWRQWQSYARALVPRPNEKINIYWWQCLQCCGLMLSWNVCFDEDVFERNKQNGQLFLPRDKRVIFLMGEIFLLLRNYNDCVTQRWCVPFWFDLIFSPWFLNRNDSSFRSQPTPTVVRSTHGREA